MKCYYEILEVPRDVNFEDLKKAYRKLAIKWHPDKNLDNTENATEQFKLIQQAFEVLSDPHERAWYDDHRDAILKGKSCTEYEDESLDIFQYFTPSCYQGFGDDEKGFYSIYREVFNTIAAEDSEFQKGDDSDFEIPSFGRSDSPYEDVKQFYDHWQSYYTKKTFSFLDIYDFRQAPNRKVLRLMEKENKKIRDKARKARSDEVKELVKFVRKRDKRVQAYAQHLLEISAEKARKLEEMRIAKIKARNSELASQKESEWAKFSNFENQLKDIEANLATEFGEMSSDNSETKEYHFDENLYCPACNKLFKTKKSLQNHERSKKHKENVQILKENMVDLDQCSEKYSSGEEDARSDLVEGSLLENNSENSNEISDDGDEDFFLQSEDSNLKTEEPNSIPVDIEYRYCKLCGVNMKSDEENDHKKSEKHLNNRKLYDDLKRQLGSDTEADCDDISGSSASESSGFLNENESDSEIFKNSKALKKQTNEKFFKLKKIDKGKLDKEIEGMCATLDDILDKNELYLKEHDSETSSNSKKEIKNKVPPINNIKIDDKVTNILLDRKSELTDKQMNKLFDLIKLEKNEFITNIKPEHIEDFGIGHFSEEMNKISEEIDKLTKKKSKTQRNKISKPNNFFEISDDDNDFSFKKQKKKSKLKQSKNKTKNSSENDPHLEIGKTTDDVHKSVSPDQSSLLKSDNDSLRPSTKKTVSKIRHSKRIDDDSVDEEKISTSCAVCKASFPSKNKLFQHLTKTGHSVYLPEKSNKSQESDTDYCKKGKGKKNRK